MLWNQEFLLINYPRTATKSLNVYFDRQFPSPVYGVLSPGNIAELEKTEKTRFIKSGRGHMNLRHVVRQLDYHGRSIEQFKAVFLPIRNPYDLMVSSYIFMRSTEPPDKNNKNFRLAKESDFTEFCKVFQPASFENWATLPDGTRPKNLHLIKFETIMDDLNDICATFSLDSDIEVPHFNQTRRSPYAEYLTDEAEQLIYKKMKYLFQLGGYDRS